jgi:hypothetical protein
MFQPIVTCPDGHLQGMEGKVGRHAATMVTKASAMTSQLFGLELSPEPKQCQRPLFTRAAGRCIDFPGRRE